jgi:hypothetical protein
VRAEHSELGIRWFHAEEAVPILVTGNETNNERVFGSANETPYVKDGIDRAVVHGDTTAITQHPETVLVAEAYWDLEWELQQHGFDFCYEARPCGTKGSSRAVA